MPQLNVLVVGATGSVGRLVVSQALLRNHKVRALVRNASSARLPEGAEMVVGDVTKPDTLEPALEGMDAVVLTLNADGQGKAAAEAVYYRAFLDILAALGGRSLRIALMTTIGVTERHGHYNRTNEGHDWKRRAERLVRRSGLPYTIVRPGWFDYNAADQHRLEFLQGDRRHSGTPSDGVISRQQIAEVLVESLTSDAATRKTFELVAETGPAPSDLDPLFAALRPDPEDALDAVLDLDNMPLDQEPDRVRRDLDLINRYRATA
ncbi:epimerase [Rhizobium sp. AC44/96]|uniref:SDR family oxidoreductase n=1 Tax=unclassified Rhizobium TaxID=2613769 RepID=UPI00080FC445|nr:MULTISPECIES: SDR family oxidoreductase [unclassified Rhizobium]MDM9622855.1 SDR family oxidoreductase [Rhizobium sp. S96]OCJ13241.1 epimerase [Rhizobium sp. AC44/96]